MDISKFILEKLPTYILFEGVEFEFIIFKDGDELRICYKIHSIDENSPHFDPEFPELWNNPFFDGYKSFLILVEGIYSDRQLYRGLFFIYRFLKRKNLISQPK